MARMLGASMARTFFGGDFLVVRNSPEPLFLVQREGVAEIYVEAGGEIEGNSKESATELAELAMEWKARAAEEVIGDRVMNYSWVLFLDVDCLVLRNLDHLLDLDDDGETAILYQTERGRGMRDSVFCGYLDDLEMERFGGRDGINSGTLAVRADVYHEVMAEWLRIQRTEPLRPTRWREQCAWNRLILDAERKHGWKARAFEDCLAALFNNWPIITDQTACFAYSFSIN